MFGLTAIGRAARRVPPGSGGKAGDALWLVGTLGDAAAGLAQLRDDAKATGPLVDIYRRPVPQLARGQALAPHAHAMMDVSDGLLLDASRLAEASGCAVRSISMRLPLSDAFVAERGNGSRCAAVRGDRRRRLCAARRASAGRDPLSAFFTCRNDDRPHRDASPPDGPRLSLVQRRKSRAAAGEIGF